VPAAVPATTADLVELIRKSGILADAASTDVVLGRSLPADPVHAANVLVRKGVLTQFQARMLLAGKIRGFRLGDYVIQDQIGQGGMGAVYLGVHQTLNRKVGIKVLPQAHTTDKVALERFLREARTAAALDHPNIVKLYDVAKQGEVRYLVMEYVEGQTLDKLIQTGGIAPNRAVGYIAQAAAGLQHAFEKGFIHRDIKPANLILTKDDTVKILDMGLARSLSNKDGLTEALDKGAVVGTADYVSPEQAMNQPGIDIRTDIYSLGVTFFTLVTGRPPFDGNTASKLVQHQLKEVPSISNLDKTFPPKLAAVVSKMMAKKPDDRYRTPADVIVALQPWLIESPSLLAAVNRTEAANNGRLSSRNLRDEPPLPTKKVPMWLWAVVGGLALVALAGGYFVATLLMGSGKPTNTGSGVTVTPTHPDSTPPTTTPVTPPTDKKPPAVTPTPDKTWTDGKVLYALDLTNQKPFTVDGSTAGMSNKIGDGDFPEGWSVKTWAIENRAKGFADDTAGGPSIGVRSVAGNAILFSPEIAFTGKHVKLRFEYISSATDKLCTVRFREMSSTKTVNDNLLKTDQWIRFERVYDVSAFKQAIRVEFHNSDKGTDLRIRNFQVLETTEK
jgi:serine/threonine protein kinase